MCRHIAYLGPAIAPATLALDAPHGLSTQCATAREMAWGQENLDGWGIAWRAGTGQPDLHRSGSALTDDAEGQQLLRRVVADQFVVHVRQMTPGSTPDLVNSAPFTDGENRFFTHNGFVPDFRNGVREQLLAKVSPARAAAVKGDTDSEVLFALVLSRIDDGAEVDEAIRAVADVAEMFGGRHNALLWAGDTMIATRWDNSLYLAVQDAIVIASEPLDDREWSPVDDRSMVVVRGDTIRKEPM